MDDPLSARAVIARAVDLGVRMLDTAEMYGSGSNEQLVGAAIRGRRRHVFLATKGGVRAEPDGTYSCHGRPEVLRAACERSLARLDVEVIDLYYLHRRDPDVPLTESVGALGDLVTAGKIRHVGLCEVTAAELEAASAVFPIAALQSEWSLTARRIDAVLPTCARLGTAVVPYAPLARGRLGRVPVLGDIARRHGIAATQVALAWLHDQSRRWGLPVVPIPGSTSVAHLESNAAAATLRLSPDDLGLLDAAPMPT
ncbi:aldo/keto reductase [Blastococcus xanthinilyticus]|nr:aldo/keto reductase [Blastococcus xanthinilyticus]